MENLEAESAQAAPILVVDDDIDIRDTLAQILEFEGFNVACATNGKEALDRLGDRALARPSLILLDLMMPVMNGYEFLDQQMAHPDFAGIPVIVLSADGNIQKKAEIHGITRYMKKPIELDALLGEIRKTI